MKLDPKADPASPYYRPTPHPSEATEIDGKLYKLDYATKKPIVLVDGEWEMYVPPPLAPIVPILDLQEVPARRLKKDIMTVYNRLGGVEYLEKVAKSDPDLYHKLLLKVIPQAVESDVRLEATVHNDIVSLPTSQLKKMFLEMVANEKVIENDGPDR